MSASLDLDGVMPGRGRGSNGTQAIAVRGLVKRYGEIEAVAGIDFEVPPGETFGFLGPNGAGKSTTINVLCTLAKPPAGWATVAGYDVAALARATRPSDRTPCSGCPPTRPRGPERPPHEVPVHRASGVINARFVAGRGQAAATVRASASRLSRSCPGR